MAAINQGVAPANTNVATIYTVPANRQAALVCNITALLACKVRMAVGSGASPAATDWIEYDLPLGVGGTVERTALVLKAGDKVFVRTDTANAIAARVWGVEEAAGS
ncbi:hypothetical protein [Antarcticirhabdus aurantiaca]|uniref:hypothetical protein n=1 Tax=Antarcticirhabdus aurantiaca TaxID=2606717 RepID=UPI00131B011B|nr:hypothetical protein [Antarcticirhabdus aurantiaca]